MITPTTLLRHVAVTRLSPLPQFSRRVVDNPALDGRTATSCEPTKSSSTHLDETQLHGISVMKGLQHSPMGNVGLQELDTQVLEALHAELATKHRIENDYPEEATHQSVKGNQPSKTRLRPLPTQHPLPKSGGLASRNTLSQQPVGCSQN